MPAAPSPPSLVLLLVLAALLPRAHAAPLAWSAIRRFVVWSAFVVVGGGVVMACPARCWARFRRAGAVVAPRAVTWWSPPTPTPVLWGLLWSPNQLLLLLHVSCCMLTRALTTDSLTHCRMAWRTQDYAERLGRRALRAHLPRYARLARKERRSRRRGR